MRIFGKLYDWTMLRARHRRAPLYLGALSFAESSFFPVPPDVMLAPMALASPQRAWHLALLTTVTSVIGGLFGYLIGVFAFEWVAPLLREWGYWQYYETAKAWFATWGFWAILIAGFSPIPYKVFTIAAGTVAMGLPGFIAASVIGRGSRFFLVAALMRWGGERMERMLRQYVDTVGWIMVVLAVVLFWFTR
jgi:membrane protein YqaA with SNARE-associated domain